MRKGVGFLCVIMASSAVTLGRSAHADGLGALSGLFLGGSFGKAQNEYDPAFVEDQLRSEATAVGDTLKYTSSAAHRTDNAWWVDAGYMPWRYVGFDVAFFHLGEFTSRAAGTLKTGTGANPFITTATVTSRGPALSALLRLPLAEAWDLGFRVGDYVGKNSTTSGFEFMSKYTATPQSSSGSSLLLGIGGAYTFAGHWSVRLDYLRLNQAGNSDTGKFNVNLATAGMTFTF